MKIELLDDKTIKVLLSKIDMTTYNLCYDEMDYKNPQTKRVILKLIDEIKKEVKINLTTGKLFIEAFPYADGGCILYVNVLDSSTSETQSQKKSKSGFDTPLIFIVEDINLLGVLSNRLITRYSHIILKSSLYLWDDKYYILLYTYFKMDSEIIKLISEYGKFYGKGTIQSSIVKEHAKELIKNDAIAMLDGCLY
ncbi:MAG: adaptor protein MecA [Oscillospiraceae bacterium]